MLLLKRSFFFLPKALTINSDSGSEELEACKDFNSRGFIPPALIEHISKAELKVKKKKMGLMSGRRFTFRLHSVGSYKVLPVTTHVM